MVDKNLNNSPAVEDRTSASALPDSADTNSGTEELHEAPLLVSNEDMAKHLELASQNASSDSTSLGKAPVPGVPLTADKYLPALDFDFGEPEYEMPWFEDRAQVDERTKRDEEVKDAERDEELKGGERGEGVESAESVERRARVGDSNSAEPTMTKEEFTALAKETLKSPGALAAFEKNVETFEKRAETDRLSQKDIEEFYGQVGRVLTESKNGNKFYDSKDLQTIASDMMRQGARPGDVNQGSMSTCTTAALETILYIQEPATVGRVVADIATTGQYIKADGSVLKTPEQNLHPSKYQDHVAVDKKRSLASHIAQPALINVHWSSQDNYFDEPVKKGSIVYEEGHATEFIGDAHTRIMDYSTNPPKPFMQPGFADPRQEQTFAGGGEERPVEGPNMHMEFMQDLYGQLRGNKGDLTIVNDKASRGVSRPETREQFDKIMREAAERGRPVLLGVHANREPFVDDLMESMSRTPLTKQQKIEQSRRHAHHAIVATGTDEKGLVSVENQWGNRVDHTGQPAQKEKLALGTVYDTVMPKQEDATVDEQPKAQIEKPSGDDFIKQQREFVSELEKDSDVKPEVLLRERMRLRDYQLHWKHPEEAHKQAELIAKHLQEQLESGADGSKVNRDVSRFISSLDGDADMQLGKDVLKASTDAFLKKEITDWGFSHDFNEQVEMHRQLGDDAGARALARCVVDSAIKKLVQPEGLAPERGLRELQQLTGDLENMKIPDQSKRVVDELLKDVRAYEKANGSDNNAVVEAKRALLFSGEKDVTPLKRQLAAEVHDSLKRITAGGDITSDTTYSARFALRQFARASNNPALLEEVVLDTLKANATKAGSPDNLDIKANFGMFSQGAKELLKLGATDKALPLMSRALDLSKKDDPDEAERLAYDIVDIYDRQGRSEEGDKLEKELGIKIKYRRKAGKDE